MAVRKLRPIEDRDPYAALVLAAFDAMENADEMGMERAAAQTATRNCTSFAGATRAETGAVLSVCRDPGGMGLERSDESLAKLGLTDP